MKFKGAFGAPAQFGFIQQGFVLVRVRYRQAHDGIAQFIRPGQGGQAGRHDLFWLFNLHAPVDEAPAGQLAPFHAGRFSRLHVGDDEFFLVGHLAKIDALDRARVNHRRLQALVEVLRLVNVTERHIGKAQVAHQRSRQHQVAAQHYAALGAIERALHRGVRSQDERQVGLGLGEQFCDGLVDRRFHLRENVLRRFAGGFLCAHQTGAVQPRQGEHLHRRAEQLGGPEQFGHARDAHIRHLQGLELLQGVRAAKGRG